MVIGDGEDPQKREFLFMLFSEVWLLPIGKNFTSKHFHYKPFHILFEWNLRQLSYVIMKGLVNIMTTEHNKLMLGSPSHLRGTKGLS